MHREITVQEQPREETVDTAVTAAAQLRSGSAAARRPRMQKEKSVSMAEQEVKAPPMLQGNTAIGVIGEEAAEPMIAQAGIFQLIPEPAMVDCPVKVTGEAQAMAAPVAAVSQQVREPQEIPGR